MSSEVAQDDTVSHAGSSSRLPFHGANVQRYADLASRYRYYTRLDPRSESSLAIPNHILPSHFFSIISYDNVSKQGSLITIFSIWNTMMGTALLAMPWALNQAGFALGEFLILAIGIIAFYTAFRVIDNTSKHQEKTLSDNVEFTDVCWYYLGVWGDRAAVIFSLISLLGATIVYWVLMSNFLYYTGICIYDAIYETNSEWSVIFNANTSTKCDVICATTFTNHSTESLSNRSSVFQNYWQLKRTIPFYLIVGVFPLMNLKSPTFFTKFNGLGTISVVYLLFFVGSKLYSCGIHMNVSSDENSIHLFRLSFPSLTGTLALSYFLHNCVVTIMKNQENPKNNTRDLSLAYLLVIVTYLLISSIFYIGFPLQKDCIADNFLNNFGSGDLLSSIARIFLLFQMLTVYPLLVYLIRLQVFYRIFKDPYPSLMYVLLLNISVILIGIIFAVFYPSIGSILRFVGSLCGLVYVFTLPCLVHMRRLSAEGALTQLSVAFHCTIVMLGILNLLAQFISI